MIRVLRSFLALVVVMALTVPSVLGAQDEDLQQLQRLRRATLEELADVGRQLDDVTARSRDADWVIVRAGDGSYVQVDLKRVDELVPWVQMALQDRGAAPALLRKLEQYIPLASLALLLPDSEVPPQVKPYLDDLQLLVAGDLESIDSDRIRGAIRGIFGARKARMAQDYADLTMELEEQRQTLEILLQFLDADIEARGGPVSPAPTLEPTWEPSLPPTEIEELPSPSPASTPLPSPDAAPSPDARPSPEPEVSPEPTPGMEGDGIEYDALKGLTNCGDGDPDCAAATPVACSEADMWCADTAIGPSLSPSLAPSPPLSLDPATFGDGGRAAIVCEGWLEHALEPPYTKFTPEQIGACFEECETWMSWHASFGDELPSRCTEPEPDEASTSAPSPEAVSAIDAVVDAFSLWDGCWATPWGQLRLAETSPSVTGTLTWTDQGGVVREARLSFEPLVAGYPDRLIGGIFDGPPTETITCASTSQGTSHWASARMDYHTDRGFHASFLPCLDDENFDFIQLDGAWESTLDRCDM